MSFHKTWPQARSEKDRRRRGHMSSTNRSRKEGKELKRVGFSPKLIKTCESMVIVLIDQEGTSFAVRTGVEGSKDCNNIRLLSFHVIN